MKTDKRTLGRYDFEGEGGSVELIATGDVDTAVALEMATTLIGLKRSELDKQRPPAVLKSAG